jgi:two-component system response regulator FixJ
LLVFPREALHGIASSPRVVALRGLRMSDKPIVCLIDKDANRRASLKPVFRAKGISYSSYSALSEFLAKYDEDRVGCVLIAGLACQSVLDDLRRSEVHLPTILMLDEAEPRDIVEAMKSGAFDVLVRPVDDEQLVLRVRKAFAVAGGLRSYQRERVAIGAKMKLLTRRENEILDMIISGERGRDIAAKLGISPKTVDIHRANILRKMKTKSLADLIRWRLIHRAAPGGVMPIIVRSK